MRRFWGPPKGLLPLGEVTFRYRGEVTFQVQHSRRNGWFCFNGFQIPPGLRHRQFNREWGLAANDPGETALMHESGWGSFTKNGCLRKVCRSIDAALDCRDRDDAAYLEAKGVGVK